MSSRGTVSRRLHELGIRVRPSGPIPSSTFADDPVAWTADLAYVVGLIATDGNLSKKRGRIAIMHDIWRLRYAKRESLEVLRWIYYAHNVACLARKRRIADPS